MTGACGTYAGYHKHLHRGMAPCETCREAKRAYESERRAERRTNLPALTHPSNTAWDAGCRCGACKESHDRRHIERYGISVAEYSALVAAQGGGCAICGATSYGSRGRRLHIDHDHACCRLGCRDCVRGVLCNRCNVWGERLPLAEWADYASRPRPFTSSSAGSAASPSLDAADRTDHNEGEI